MFCNKDLTCKNETNKVQLVNDLLTISSVPQKIKKNWQIIEEFLRGIMKKNQTKTNKSNVSRKLSASSALIAAGLMFAAPASAEVVNGQFVSGSGSFSHTANKTTITVETAKSIANFKDYNIGTNQQVHYQNALSGSANHLSRVTGGNESRILGKLTSDRVNVFLVNPNGIFFGKNSVVDVPNFVASTSDITNANFNAGNYKFDIKGKANAKIVNQGTITVGDTGLAALVAPGVENEGIIVANKGTIALAAGEEFTLDMYGDQLISFAVTEENNDRFVKQSGELIAKEGFVLLTAQDANDVVNSVINLDGVVEANTVKVEGGDIVLGSTSEINVAGKNGGGKVSVKGKNIEIQKGSKIIADSTVDGDGGEVIAIAENEMDFAGEISAQGKGNGKGGFVETSGQTVFIRRDGYVNTLAENGIVGEWLIDPINFTVSSNATSANNYNNADLATDLETTNVTIDTNVPGTKAGNITVKADVIKAAGAAPTTLKFIAMNNFTLNSGVTIASIASALNVAIEAVNKISIKGLIDTNGGFFKATNLLDGFASSFKNTGAIDAKGGDIFVKANKIEIENSLTTTGTGQTNLTATGDITLDAAVTAGDGVAATHDLLVTTSGGDIEINSSPSTTGSARFEAAAGKVVLDAGISAASLSGDTDNVEVQSNDGIINQAIEIVNVDGTVKLKNDTYDQTVFINKNLTLEGSSEKNTKIAPTSAPTQEFKNFFNDLYNRALILVDGASNVTIKNLKVDGANAGDLSAAPAGTRRNVGIGFDNAGGLIDDVVITNISDNNKARGEGITVQADKDDGDASRTLTVQNSEITNYQFEAISADGDRLTMNVLNNKITGLGNAVVERQGGIMFLNGTSGLIEGNTISGNTKAGGAPLGDSKDIFIKNANNTVIKNNNIKGDGRIAILVEDSNNVTLAGNDIRNHDVALQIDDSNGTILNGGNKFINNTTGIEIYNGTSNAAISDTRISKGDTQISLDGSNTSVSFGTGVELDNAGVNYISLESGAMNGQNLDATAVEFNGKKGSATSDKNNFKIEDKINHELDNTNVGLVEWKDNTNFATQNNLGIQQAIDSADASWDVSVAKGTYDESLFINKDLDIYAGNGKVTLAPTSNPTNEFAINASVFSNPIILAQDANVNITEIDVDGSNVGTGVASNRFISGIAYDNASGTIDDVVVKNISNDGNRRIGTGILVDSKGAADSENTVTIQNSDVEKYQRYGVWANGNKATVDVKDSKFTGLGGSAVLSQSGLRFRADADGEISGNTFRNNDFTDSNDILGDNAGSLEIKDNDLTDGKKKNGTVGIKLNNGTADAIISGNQIKKHDIGLLLDGSTGAVTSDNTFENNNTGIDAINGSTFLSVAGSTFRDNENGILADETSDNLLVEDSFFYTNADSGIELDGSDNAEVKRSYFEGNEDGIEADADANFLTVRKSQFIDNIQAGVQGESADDIKIVNSEFRGNESGVDLLDSDRATIKGEDTLFVDNNFGIYAENSEYLSVKDSTFRKNGDGVFLDTDSDRAEFIRSTFNNNYEGIFSEAADRITIKDSTFRNNDAGFATGGGRTNRVDVKNSKFIDNDFGIAGTNLDKLEVKDSTFRDNTTVGIALFKGSDDAVVSNTVFRDNGTGIGVEKNSDNLLVKKESIFRNNDIGIDILRNSNNVTVKGGTRFVDNEYGIMSSGNSGMTVNNAVFRGNTLAGIYLTDLNIGSTIKNSTFVSNSVGVRADTLTDDLVVNNSTFRKNRGGVILENTQTSDIKNSTFRENGIGVQVNGGIAIVSVAAAAPASPAALPAVPAVATPIGDVTISNGRFIDNGIGVQAQGFSNIDIKNSTFRENRFGVEVLGIPSLSRSRLATKAPFPTIDSDIKISNSTFVENSVGVKADDIEGIIVSNSTFRDNTEFGIALNNANDFKVNKGSSFIDNPSGIYALNSDDLTVKDSTFTDNDSGVRLEDSKRAAIKNSTFTENGVGVEANNSNRTKVQDSTFTENGIGTRLTSSNNGQITDSTFNDNPIGVAIREGSSNTTIADTNISGGATGLFVDGSVSGNPAPISLTLENLVFGGTQTEAAIEFHNATLVGDVSVSNVQLLSDAPVGWRFENVEGEAPSDSYGPGDMDFGTAIFGPGYTIADIELVNSTMDGEARNVTFIGDNDNPFIRETRVIHDLDNTALGTIFYDGIELVIALRNFLGDLLNRTNLDIAFFNEISTAGQVFSNPGINGNPAPVTFNTANNTQVSLNATSTTQLASATPEELNNLATAAGEDPASFENLEPNAGNNYNTVSCDVNFANSFLGEDVLLADASGSCED